jgi:prepilin signal peptidase PulO-like enzyme (type II secretory pathway)
MDVLIFLIGMCCGSFVNMLVYRTAENYDLIKKNESKQKKRSFCDFCGKQLNWYENIPVISWLIQKGKSRCCDNPLPWEYPVVEIGMGILFVLIKGEGVLGMIVMTMLVFGAVFDAKYMILPDFSTLILIIVAGLRLVMDGFDWNYVISAVGAAGFLGFLYLLTKGKGMGLGDVKLAIFMGLWLGWPKTLLAFYVAFIVGAIVGIILMAKKKLKRKSIMAFGPFLILGTMIASFWGEKIISNLTIFNLY